MNIALDMMGGDFAPLEAVKGIEAFFIETSAAMRTPDSHRGRRKN